MTRHRSFKRLVRARMEKTGERYAAARTALLRAGAGDGAGAGAPQPLPAPDDTIRARTGRGWEEWLDLLDEAGGPERTHRELAGTVAGLLGLDPLAWNVQAVVTGYERARGRRVVGQRADGSFSATATRTIGVPVDVLYHAVVDPAARGDWLDDDRLTPRTSTRARSARFDWGGGGRVLITFDDRGDDRAAVSVWHERLTDAGEAERMKAFWRARVATLKEVLES